MKNLRLGFSTAQIQIPCCLVTTIQSQAAWKRIWFHRPYNILILLRFKTMTKNSFPNCTKPNFDMSSLGLRWRHIISLMLRTYVPGLFYIHFIYIYFLNKKKTLIYFLKEMQVLLYLLVLTNIHYLGIFIITRVFAAHSD